VTEMDTLDSIRGPKGLFNCSVVRSGNLTGGFADGQSLISASSSVIGFIQILPIARPIKQKRWFRIWNQRFLVALMMV